MAGTDFNDAVHGMLDGFREQSEWEQRWQAAEKAFQTDLDERAKVFHGSCGQILFGEAKKGRVNEETAAFGGNNEDIDMTGDQKQVWDMAFVNYSHTYSSYGIAHEETGFLPVHAYDSRGAEVWLSLRVHRFRPLIPIIRGVRGPEIVPDLNEALYVADMVTHEKGERVVSAIDVGYEITGTKLTYFAGRFKHKTSLIPESMRPGFLAMLEGTNAVLEAAVQQNYPAQTTKGS